MGLRSTKCRDRTDLEWHCKQKKTWNFLPDVSWTCTISVERCQCSPSNSLLWEHVSVQYAEQGGDSLIPEGNLLSNIDRFTGFADGYDRNRPQAPQFVTRILRDYLGHRPARVADVGCGTGLSTFIWKDAADQIIGVEPSPDMLTLAKHKLALYTDAPHISFEQGYSNTLPLPSSSVDIITCSQSFHWMEPTSTLKEAGRVLREGGIFAAYDCEWLLVRIGTLRQPIWTFWTTPVILFIGWQIPRTVRLSWISLLICDVWRRAMSSVTPEK